MSDNDDNDQQEQELYDEFGNYIGPDLDDEDSSSSDDDGSNPSSSNSSIGSGGGGENDKQEDNDHHDGAMVIAADQTMDDINNNNNNNAIVLHEDKEHYTSADQIYGDDVKVAVLDEDAMDLDKPIIEPVITKTHQVGQQPGQQDGINGIIKDDDLIYSSEYLGMQLLNETTRTRRGIAIVGHFHHGKTCFMDLLLESTFRDDNYWGPRASLPINAGGGPRYLDTWISEQDRQMSLCSTPITCLLNDSRNKSYCITAVDCPGHVNFYDENVAIMRCMDGVGIVIDAVEGIMIHTEILIKHAIINEGLPIVLIISKIDRLIIELKLPPRDMYYKLLNIVESVNEYIYQITGGKYPVKISPERNNVAFTSAQNGYIFTCKSFAQLYVDHHDENELGTNLSVNDFAKRLWGDCYLDPGTKTFHKSARDCPSYSSSSTTIERTFVTYILEPLYKIYTVCLGEHEKEINTLLRSVGVLLKKEQMRNSSTRPLLRTALKKFFGGSACSTGAFIDMIVQHIPYPMAAAKGKIARCYTGPITTTINNEHTINDDGTNYGSSYSPIVQSMIECNPNGPLIIHCVKNYATPDGKSFLTFGRIYSGSIKPGEQVKVLGEGYTPQDDEDVAGAVVESVAIPRGRGYTKVSIAKAGNWVLLEGVDATIAKTATIVSKELLEKNYGKDDDDDDAIHIFAPLKFPHAGNESVMKLAIEPLNPAELPKMVDGLRRISKSYPMARTKVEESGEHIVFGTGELYMDCIMHDLRHVYSDIEIKVSDPIVAFRETVIESSSLKCHSETANKRNKLTFMAEPLDDGLAEKLEVGKVNPNWDAKKIGRFFQTQYNWDLLSSRSVWAFGDSPTHGTNILMDDTLPSEVDKSLLYTCKSSIVQGFQWATREGPLCEEPVRATKLKILEVSLADRPIYRGGGQIIPTARRVVHSSLLTATPRLMEPVYRLQIQCPGSIVNSIQPVLTRRRGHIVQDRPISGTTLFSVKGYIPMLDSFGFETDLRTFTQGQAMVFSVFDHWSIVPGDPLDQNIILHPLEPSPPQHLARELLVKTRRRKGLSEDVTISKFFDDAMKAQLLGSDFNQVMEMQ